MTCESAPVSPARDFTPIALTADDDLPEDILLLLVYRQRLPDEIAVGLAAALSVFPHLTGRVVENPPRVVADADGAVWIESAVSDVTMRVEDFENLTHREMRGQFAPVGREGGLFAVRRVDFPRTGVTALCIRASHRVVDGTGLGLFLAHATAAMRGGAAPPPVVHARGVELGFPVPAMPGAGGMNRVPDGYRIFPDGGDPVVDALAAETPWWFAIATDDVRRVMGAGDAAAALRHRLAGFLCGETARLHPAMRRVAVWCGTRGRGGMPQTFTGNAGCYLHVDIADDDTALARAIQSLASRRGMIHARETHRKILELRAAGCDVRWDGPHDHLLQLNLLAPPVEVADFGCGRPAFALLLSRNASGLRIFPSVCGGRFVVEATLPPGVAAALADACARRGLNVDVWGGGESA